MVAKKKKDHLLEAFCFFLPASTGEAVETVETEWALEALEA